MMPTLLDVTFDTPLHPVQREVADSSARFRVLAAGRRLGKTKLGALLAVKRAVEGGAVWWVAPDYPRAQIGWREIKRLALQIPGAIIRESEKRIEFPGVGFLQSKSGSDADTLRGEGLDLVVIDEAAFMKEDAWAEGLRPALSDRLGAALLISTFDGENWFYDAYERGQDPEHEDWESWRVPTSANPYIPPEEIELARKTSPEAVFEQEYMANPLVYVGAVFHGEHVQRASEIGQSAVWRLDLSTSAGLDWGYSNPTAFEVCQEDPEGKVSWIEERLWHSTELNVRCAAIVGICEELKVLDIYSDAAGADENATLAVALERAGLKTIVHPVPFGKYKESGIQARRFYLERGQEAISPRCPTLLKDSKRYRYREDRDKVLKDEVLKKDDHTVDAATAFYASRRGVLVGLSKARGA